MSPSCRMGAGCSSPSIDCRDRTPSPSLPTASGRMSSGSRGNLFDCRSIHPRGILLYSREATNPGVWAVRFSLSRLATEGEPILVAAGGATPSLAADGTLALVRPSDQPAELISIDRQGSVTPITVLPAPASAYFANWSVLGGSADRQKFAVMLRAAVGQELFTYDTVRRTVTRVSQGTGAGANPTWSTDGRRIFFATFAGARVWNIYAVSSTESSRPERVLPPSDQMQWPCSVSPDGRLILYAEGMDSTTDLWVAPISMGQPHRSVSPTRLSGRLTESFHRMAGGLRTRRRNPAGRTLYVRSFPIASDRIPISTGGGAMPAWTARWAGGDFLSRPRIDVFGQVGQDAIWWSGGLSAAATLPHVRPASAAFLFDLGRRPATDLLTIDGQRSRKCAPQLGRARRPPITDSS